MSVAVLARCGRSFRLAGRLLPGDTLQDAASLYAFCRAVDDLADDSSDASVARAELLALKQAVLAGDVGHGPARPFLALQARRGVTARSAATLIDTVLGDLDPVRVADEAALMRYAYGAAGTVGEMMCAVLDVRTAQALPHAVELGMAMQLTNIARDVIEDAAHGRIYLPASWLPASWLPASWLPASWLPEEVAAGTLAMHAEAVFPAVRRVLERADQGYRNGERGYAHLPARVRPAIRAASRLYEEIGLRILSRGPAYLLAGRCVVPGPRKLVLLAAALLGTERPARRKAGFPALVLDVPGARA